MTFEEFFKKKKIGLDALSKGDSDLFAEFKQHYELMGEKSFDHTKKYWFNSLRRLYPLPPEVKAEKVVIENQLAEQAVAESLADPILDKEKKTGFTPRFRAGATIAKPQAETSKEEITAPEEKPVNDTPPTAAPKGFTPRFKAGVTSSKKEETAKTEEKPAEEPTAEKPTEAAKAPTGFKPRFKAGVTKSPNVPPHELGIKDSATVTPDVNQAATEQADILKQNPDADINQVKPEFEKEKEQTQEDVGSPERTDQHFTPQEIVESKKQDKSREEEGLPAPAKLGFKPRFKAGVTTTKKDEQEPIENKQESSSGNAPEAKDRDQSSPEPPVAPKLGFKPRFKPPQS